MSFRRVNAMANLAGQCTLACARKNNREPGKTSEMRGAYNRRTTWILRKFCLSRKNAIRLLYPVDLSVYNCTSSPLPHQPQGSSPVLHARGGIELRDWLARVGVELIAPGLGTRTLGCGRRWAILVRLINRLLIQGFADEE